MKEANSLCRYQRFPTTADLLFLQLCKGKHILPTHSSFLNLVHTFMYLFINKIWWRGERRYIYIIYTYIIAHILHITSQKQKKASFVDFSTVIHKLSLTKNVTNMQQTSANMIWYVLCVRVPAGNYRKPPSFSTFVQEYSVDHKTCISV